MYPIAHLYLMELSLKRLDDAAVLGSIFPDLVILSGLDWITSHSLGQQIWHHFHSCGEEKVLFSLGVISHGIKPRGLDYYSDEKYGTFEKGYCFEKARPIVDVVVEACSLSAYDGWWKAHNFIEMGVELYLYDRRPELILNLRKALSNGALIASLIHDLCPVLQIEKAQLEKSFKKFRHFAAEGPIDALTFAKRYQKQIYLRHKIESININRARDIIEEAKKMVLPDIEDFFQDVKGKMASIWPVSL